MTKKNILALDLGAKTGFSIRFEVIGDPVAKGRARSRIVKPKSKSQFVSHYTPKKTVAGENKIATAGALAMISHEIQAGPLELTVDAYFKIPASWPKAKRADALAGRIRPTSKPDWDNIGKLASDALNGVVWLDDSQIVSASTQKFYAGDPSTVITVRSWEVS
jgi:Holliday junction resolvase RusA-like endonuclease